MLASSFQGSECQLSDCGTPTSTGKANTFDSEPSNSYCVETELGESDHHMIWDDEAAETCRTEQISVLATRSLSHSRHIENRLARGPLLPDKMPRAFLQVEGSAWEGLELANKLQT